MKKIVALILLMSMVLTFVACAGKEITPPDTTPEDSTPEDSTPEDTTPEITLQEVYEAGKSLSAMLGDHESVYAQVISEGKVIREEYLSKQYCYSFYDEEFMDIGFEYYNFATNNAEYYYFDNTYALNVTLSPNGVVETTDILDLVGSNSFISSEILDDDAASIVEKDGYIIASCTADPEEIATMGEGIVSCVESYTIDATTREMTAIKTVYTYEDGTVEEGAITITRDVDYPEGMKPFLKYVQETEMRTVTIVSNPGTENEKIESVQVPKGLQVSVSAEFGIEEIFTTYADAACTQTFDGEWDVNTDLTIYVKWNEQAAQ